MKISDDTQRRIQNLTYIPEGQAATLPLNWSTRTDVICSGYKAAQENELVNQRLFPKMSA